MVIDEELLFRNAESYAHSKRIQLWRKDKLGHGSDGSVWPTSRGTAVKSLHAAFKYTRELTCYRRLLRADVRNIGGFDVPRLIDFDNSLQVIEMSVVTPPYLLDFGKVKLDQPPAYYFDRQYQANRETEGRSYFGDRWPDVAFAMYDLQKRFGIYYADPKPGNINLGYDPVEDSWDKEPNIDYSDYD